MNHYKVIKGLHTGYEFIGYEYRNSAGQLRIWNENKYWFTFPSEYCEIIKQDILI